MLLSAGLLFGCIAISRWIHGHSHEQPGHTSRVEAPLSKKRPLEVLMSDRYLLWIAALMVVVNVVNSNGEYLLGKFVASEATRIVGADETARSVFIGQFVGSYASLYSGAGLLLQTFAVSRLFRSIGVAGALYILPLLAFSSYSLMIVLPVLEVVRWVKVMENGTDYSIQNTARQALFLPVSREAKYKAKTAIDTFFVRFGDLLQAGLVFAGTTWFSLGVKGFAAVNVVLTVVWLLVVTRLAREYRQRAEPSSVAAAPAGSERVAAV
jgi:AAA family ATP:ADP antiporter